MVQFVEYTDYDIGSLLKDDIINVDFIDANFEFEFDDEEGEQEPVKQDILIFGSIVFGTTQDEKQRTPQEEPLIENKTNKNNEDDKNQEITRDVDFINAHAKRLK